MKVESAEYICSANRPEGMPKSELPEVGFAGRSNVGKSSLINCLVGNKRLCRTSSTPGRTRCLNFFLINSSLYFVDFPGYGYAQISKEMRQSFRVMVEPYLSTRHQMRGMVLLLDGRHPPMPSDLELKEWLIIKGLNYRVILTKMDKLPKGKWAQAQGQAAELLGCERGEILLFSANTGEGKKQVWQAIEDILRGHGLPGRRRPGLEGNRK